MVTALWTLQSGRPAIREREADVKEDEVVLGVDEDEEIGDEVEGEDEVEESCNRVEEMATVEGWMR